MKSNIHDIDVVFVRETEKAYGIRSHEDGDLVWVAKSQCELEPKVGPELVMGRLAVLTAEEWLLSEKELI